MLDIIRYELLHEGISLGLLTASFSITGLNFLWSPNLLSIFFTNYSWTKRILLLLFISTCCILTSIVGPASAILFVPTQLWRQNGWTHIHLGGDNNTRWPLQLTAENTGPGLCGEHSTMLELVCPGGGYDNISPRLRYPPAVVYSIPIPDCYYTRFIRGRAPWLHKSAAEQMTPEIWVHTPRADVTFMMNDINMVYGDAQNSATGRNKRLRDFVDGVYQIAPSKLPVGRVVCGPPQLISSDTKTLSFPVLAPDHKWRNFSTKSMEESWGPVIEHYVGNMSRLYATKEHATQANTQWIPLWPEFGAATAGLAVISQNLEITVARGCTLDFRWATGHTIRISENVMTSATGFVSLIDEATPPPDSSNHFMPYDPGDFFDPRTFANYGPTITASIDWLDAAFPTCIAAGEASGYNMTTIEAMIDRTTASYPDWVISNDTTKAFNQLLMVE